MSAARAAALALALLAFGGGAPVAAASDGAPDYLGVPVLQTPEIEAERRVLGRLAVAGRADAAEQGLQGLLARAPLAPVLHATRAVARIAAGDAAGALDSLTRAAAGGFSEMAALAAAPPFAGLNQDGRLDAIVAGAAAPTPSAAAPAVLGPDLTALVTPGVARWRGDLGALELLFDFPADLARRPVRGPERKDDAARQLRRLQAQGKAAGNAGDLYDNRDSDHSGLSRADYPQLGFVEYGPEAQAAGRHYGANLHHRFNAPTFGNSSTASTSGALWRSLPRLILTHPDGPAALAGQYASNHLYIYPAHKDVGEPHGDLIPANTPYLLASRGSSGTDKPLMQAVADTLAAFRPDTKRFLIERGLIAPTVQMILRRSLTAVRSEDAYFSAAAHPAVFPGKALSAPRMVALANALKPGDAPGPTRIAVVEEAATQGELAQSGGLTGETLFDTPSAVARAARGPAYARRYLLSAEATQDPNGRPLRFVWRVFGVGAERATVTPIGPDGARAEVVVPWPDVPGGGRLDVAVFAHNGAHPSAPAFLSLLFPAREARSYDAEGRALAVDYAARPEEYVDPLVFPARDWRDTYDYAPDGRLLGWTRTRAGAVERFTRHGLRVLETDAQGRPMRAEQVGYAQRTRRGKAGLEATPTGEVYRYAYADAEDLTGVAEGEGAAAGRTLD